MNIELHGFSDLHVGSIKGDLFRCLSGQDMVVTVIPSVSENVSVGDVPFIRVYSDKQEDFVATTRALRMIHFGFVRRKIVVEYVLLHSCLEI